MIPLSKLTGAPFRCLTVFALSLAFFLAHHVPAFAESSRDYALYCADNTTWPDKMQCKEYPDEVASEVIAWLQANRVGTGNCYAAGNYYKLEYQKSGPLRSVYPSNPTFSYDQDWVEMCGPYVQAGGRGTMELTGVAAASSDHDKPSHMCGFGHPIFPLTGTKRLVVDVGGWPGLSLQLAYDTRSTIPADRDSQRKFRYPSAPASFGALWESNLHKRILQQSVGAQSTLRAGRGLGEWTSFTWTSSGYVADADINDRVVTLSGMWRYYDAANKSEETYAISSGALESLKRADGTTLNFTYSTASTPTDIAPAPDLLIAITDQFGHSLQLTYTLGPVTPIVASITSHGPGGDSGTTSFSYDDHGNLKLITWPDQTARQFIYDDPLHPWALTGVVDESNKRLYTYAYDENGYAIDTQAAGGVDHYHASWTTPPTWHVRDTYEEAKAVVWRNLEWLPPQNTVVTLPNGESITLDASSVLSANRLARQSQPAGSGCGASASSQGYEGNGNISQKDDFDGHRACYAYDTSNRETARVEGLSTSAACSSVLPASSALPAGSRKTSTQWHPDWRLTTKVAEPGRITTSIYNGQPDPFNAGATASCAPSTALLPDGKPIAVLCKKVEQATTDADGSQAFNAVLDTKVPNRVWTDTYNGYGQVLTAKGPRTDVDDTVTYTYYGDTTSTHTMGDLATVKNALGQTTQYTQYDPHGNVLQMIDANSVTTTYSYDLRQRLKTVSVAGATTTYDYWPTGLLKQVSLPDQSTVSYAYDDAHRLTDVTDSLGNSVHYTLDNAGNRTAEQYKDPSGALKREIDHVIDALGRIQQTTGRE